MNKLEEISKCVLEGDDEAIEGLLQEALDAGLKPAELINQGLIAGMDEVGVLFKEGDLFVPEVLMSAQTMNLGMQKLKPLLGEGEETRKGKILLLTVQGDLHDIGKNLCAVMLESSGFDIVDLGIDVSPQAVYDAVVEHEPDIVAMSAMLTTTMHAMDATCQVLKEKGLADQVAVMVGGAPLNDAYAKKIGAFYSSDASGSVELALQLLKAN